MLGVRLCRQASQRILLTGAGGHVGQDMVVFLQQKYGASNILATDIALRKFKWPPATQFKKLDVMDDVATDNLAAEFKPTRVYHFASIATESEHDPQRALRVNMEGVKNMLEIAKKHNCSVFFPSTIGAFGPGTPQVPSNLEIMRPITINGITNIHMELLGEYYNRRYNVDVRSARIPIVNSYHDISQGASDFTVHAFYDLFRTNKAVIPVWEDVRMPLIYFPDVLRSLDQLMETPSEKLSARVYTMACISVTAKEYVEELRRLFPTAEITYEPDYRDELMRTWPSATDASVAKKDWGHSLTFDLPAMMNDMYAKIKAKLGKKAVLSALCFLACALRQTDYRLYSTAQGQLTAGTQTLNDAVGAIRQEVNASDRLLDEQYDRYEEVITDSTGALLNSELVSRQNDIVQLQSRLDYVNTVLAAADNQCAAFGSCALCTQSENCVWCPSTGNCIAGDSLGPVTGQCGDFVLGGCAVGCQQYSECQPCVARPECAWCGGLQLCGARSDAETCEFPVATDLAGTACSEQPAASRTAPMAIDVGELRREVTQTQQTISSLQDDVSTLRSQLSSLASSSSTSPSIPLIVVSDSLSGLPATADSLTRAEAQRTLSQVNDLAVQVANDVSTAGINSVNQNNQLITTLENNFSDTIANTRRSIEDQAAADRAARAAQREAERQQREQEAAASAATQGEQAAENGAPETGGETTAEIGAEGSNEIAQGSEPVAEGNEEIPEEGSSTVPEEGSAVPEEGSSAVPEEGGAAVSEEGSSAVPEEGSSAVPEEGSSAVPEEGSTAISEEGSAAVPEEGGTAVSEEETEDVISPEQSQEASVPEDSQLPTEPTEDIESESLADQESVPVEIAEDSAPTDDTLPTEEAEALEGATENVEGAVAAPEEESAIETLPAAEVLETEPEATAADTDTTPPEASDGTAEESAASEPSGEVTSFLQEY